MNINMLLGETLKSVTKSDRNDSIVFETINGVLYQMYHSQDCCENVLVEDIEGDLNDLVGAPILQAGEINSRQQDEKGKPENAESFTWTFYKLATIKGYVTIRWLGESNGFYSESVDFIRL